jgi:hypothetical protein
MADKKGKKKIKHHDLKPKKDVKGGKLPPGTPGRNVIASPGPNVIASPGGN